MSENVRNRLLKEREAELARRQLLLLPEEEQAAQRKKLDLDVELELRTTHYKVVLELLKTEEERIVKQILPARYALRGDAHVYPVAVELRLPGGAA